MEKVTVFYRQTENRVIVEIPDVTRRGHVLRLFLEEDGELDVEKSVIKLVNSLNSIGSPVMAECAVTKTASGYDVEWNLAELYRQIKNMSKRLAALEASREHK